MTLDGRAITSLSASVERALFHLGDDPTNPQHWNILSIYDLVVQGVVEAAEELDIPFAQQVETVTLVAGTSDYTLDFATLAEDAVRMVTGILAVTLFDDAVPADLKEREIHKTTTNELLEERGDQWRENDGTPIAYVRGGSIGINFNKQIRLYPTPNAAAILNWPKIKIYTSIVNHALTNDTDFDVVDGKQFSRLLTAGCYYALSQAFLSKRDDTSLSRASVWRSEYDEIIRKVKRKANREPIEIRATDFHDL